MPTGFLKVTLCAIVLSVGLFRPQLLVSQKKLRPEPLPALLTVREQLALRERWLKTRLDTHVAADDAAPQG